MIRHKPIGAGITGGHRTTLMSGALTRYPGHTHHQEAKPFTDLHRNKAWYTVGYDGRT